MVMNVSLKLLLTIFWDRGRIIEIRDGNRGTIIYIVEIYSIISSVVYIRVLTSLARPYSKCNAVIGRKVFSSPCEDERSFHYWIAADLLVITGHMQETTTPLFSVVD